MADYSCYCYFDNNGPVLTYVDKHASWGSWEKAPPQSIQSRGGWVGFRLKDNTGPAGSEGWVTYKAEDGKLIKMSFGCPYVSGNNYARIECDATAPYKCAGILYSGAIPTSENTPSWSGYINEGELAQKGHPIIVTFSLWRV